ncbi:ABC transporter permease [Herminiimonas sp. KBW02]|uniref:ABC transporter permease n=1 Tax=Herminiimonas sp. KBW02 TaxID=2153363 RepID=UPI000F592779|nr:FtsX-like permease family protein [Herminiimonas sp. KBW02]RQO33328.1 ABC transporter permease [Herminiimonas sp. KBW02]
MIPLARKTMLHEWRRFIPAVMAVGFCGVLLAVQAALVLGIFGSAAVYVTASSADLWAGYPGTQSVNFGRSIGADVEMRLRMEPEVTAVEPYIWVDGDWRGTTDSSGIAVYISGIDTQGSMMFSHLLSPALRRLLQEPGAVIVDKSEREQLNVGRDGKGWINGQPVHIVATLAGLRGLGGVNVVTSLDTARTLQTEGGAGATYYVAKLQRPAQAPAVAAKLLPDARFGPYAVWTADAFAKRSQLYWLFDTGAGVAVLFMAVIVLLVGAVITSQSLLGVIASSAREYAMLNALGVSHRSLSRIVIEQSGWIGGAGLIVATLASALLLACAAAYGVPTHMNMPVATICMALVIILALVSGLFALRGLMRADPTLLLR